MSLLFSLKVCDRSRSPLWSEAFYFLVHDPKQEMLIVKVSAVWFSVSVHCRKCHRNLPFTFTAFFTCVAFECMGRANGISCSPCEAAAFQTTAGPGWVDASGWSLTWQWDSFEGWTQGKTRATLTTGMNSQHELHASNVYRSWTRWWLKLHSQLWLIQRKKRWCLPLTRLLDLLMRTNQGHHHMSEWLIW